MKANYFTDFDRSDHDRLADLRTIFEIVRIGRWPPVLGIYYGSLAKAPRTVLHELSAADSRMQ